MALGWVKRRGAQHNGSQGIVKSIEQRRRQLQRFGSGLLQHVRHVAPLSYGPAPKQLGEQESSAVDIHQGRDRFAAHRFGGHVAGAARSIGLAGVAGRPGNAHGNPEIHDSGAATGVKQHVGRLEIAVDHAVGMGCGQGTEDVLKDRHGLGSGHCAFRREALGQSLTGHVLEDQVGLLLVHIGFKHRHDVGVRQAADTARLLQPLLDGRRLLLGHRLHLLDGNLALQARVKCQPDLCLCPLPQQSLELKTADMGFHGGCGWPNISVKYGMCSALGAPAETLEAPPRNGRRTMRMLSAKA